MNSLIIFDWDDTLFPTSWTVKQAIDVYNINDVNKYTIYFSQLDVILHKLLTKLLKVSNVIIVTNAMSKWITITANILPNTQKLLNKQIPVISARDKFKSEYPDDGYAWKRLTFNNIVDHYKNKHNNILSIGDAYYELYALMNLYKTKNKSTYYKSVKLLQQPSFDLLLNQLNMLYKSTIPLLKMKKNMDLKSAEL